MPYLNTHARTTGPTNNDLYQPTGRTPALFGVFVGFIKDASDVQRNGRLRVWIPELGSAPDDADSWVIVNYCSPFAGATNVETISKSGTQSFEGTQTSYGFWMVPPDINNQVLVMFINGDPSRGIWIGCLYNQYMNNMVPGMAADAKNWQHPGKNIPVAEYNKNDQKVTRPDSAMKPYEKTKFKGVGNQGLINDKARGITTSSARREAPSNVFGIITPGPVIDEKASPENIRRKGGNSFIMDDQTGSEYAEFATKSGSRIRLDETNGFVYLINRDGTAWIQMDQKGHIDVFSQFDISLRAMRDVSIRADRHLNFEAGQNVYISAAMDTKLAGTKPIVYDINNTPKSFDVPWYKKFPRGCGDGGNIVLEAQWDMHTTVVQHNLYVSTLGIKKCKTPFGAQYYRSRRNFEFETDSNYNLQANHTIFVPPTPTGEIRMQAETDYSLKVLGIQDPTFPYKGKISMDSLIYGLSTKNEIVNKIREDGDFQIKAPLDVEKDVKFGKNLDVHLTFNAKSGIFDTTFANISGALISNANRFNGILTPVASGVPGGNGGPVVVVPEPEPPTDPVHPPIAEMKELIIAGDILPPISDPFFSRPMQGWPTITSRWPTYEPCPLHETFNGNFTTGYVPPMTEGDKTYKGSANGGATTSPSTNTDQGANNKILPPPDTQDSVVSKDFNNKAFECQLKAHEGIKSNSYLDSKGLPTAGIGHLLRADEIAQYPIGTKVSDEQVSRWFQQDSATSIKDAQNFIGMETWNKLDDNRKRALADMAYNMGADRLGQFKTFKKEMQAGNYDQAAKQIENTPYYQQVKTRGPKIASQIRNGTDPNGCDKKFKME